MYIFEKIIIKLVRHFYLKKKCVSDLRGSFLKTLVGFLIFLGRLSILKHIYADLNLPIISSHHNPNRETLF